MVQKASGGWRLVIDLSDFSGYVTPTRFKIGMVSSVLGDIRSWCSSLTSRRLLSSSYSPWFTAIHSYTLEGGGLTVNGSLLWPFLSFPGLHQSNFSGVGVDSQERDSVPLLIERRKPVVFRSLVSHLFLIVMCSSINNNYMYLLEYYQLLL